MDIHMSNDSWQTPQWLFDELNEEFHFDIDLCATRENSKCLLYSDDYLNNTYRHREDLGYSLDFTETLSEIALDDRAAWMNPPYSNSLPFIEKAWEDSKHCKIVCLVKVDPSTKWWATFWDYDKYTLCNVCGCEFYNSNMIACEGCGSSGSNLTIKHGGPLPGCEVRFFPKRIQFDPPQQFIDSREVWKRCGRCKLSFYEDKDIRVCEECNQKLKWVRLDSEGYKELSGPAFPSCLVIMDRRAYYPQ